MIPNERPEPMRYIISALMASAALLPASAQAEVPRVVTDIPPVHSLVAQVMGDLGTPELLLEPGADEHSFQLRPSQAAAVAEAGLVVWIGPELTPWLEGPLETRPEGAAALALLTAEGTLRRDYAEAGHEDHAHDDHGHEDHATTDAASDGHDDHAHGETAAEGYDDHGHDHDHAHDHAHDGTDPHAWLDPGNGKVWLGLIAAQLSDLDPENAATYAANAKAAVVALEALDAQLAARLEPVKDKPVVTFHDAYGYFGGHYGLTFAGSIALGDASSPGAQRLSALRAELEEGAVLCIFPEAQHSPDLVTQMAEGTGAKVGGVLDPVGSTLEAGPGAYAALLTGMAETIAGCLEG